MRGTRGAKAAGRTPAVIRSESEQAFERILACGSRIAGPTGTNRRNRTASASEECGVARAKAGWDAQRQAGADTHEGHEARIPLAQSHGAVIYAA